MKRDRRTPGRHQSGSVSGSGLQDARGRQTATWLPAQLRGQVPAELGRTAEGRDRGQKPGLGRAAGSPSPHPLLSFNPSAPWKGQGLSVKGSSASRLQRWLAVRMVGRGKNSLKTQPLNSPLKINYIAIK